MSHFEYLAIAFSLVFSFSAMRLLSGLPYAIRADRRYGPHLGFVIIHLLGTAITFWNFWAYREIDWTLVTFLLALLQPGVVFFISCALVPENPSEVESWRGHYYAARRSFFLGLLVWAIVVTGLITFVLGIPWLHRARSGSILLVALSVIGLSSSSHRVHMGLVLVAISAMAIAAATVYLRVGV